MGADQQIDWQNAAASALAWWADAGVDTLTGDDPHDWLATPVPTGPAMPAAVPAQPTPALPASLDAFLDWRIGTDAPDGGWPGAAVRFEGPATAALMVLVDCPDREDCATGTLLGGKAGQLFDRMMAAIGLERREVHLAAICARRPVAGRIPTDSEAALAAAARHHVGLVAPRRLLLMGGATTRAMLGIDGMRARGAVHEVRHDGGTIDTIATYHPRFLLDKPMAKADAWRDLQILKRGMM